MQEEPSWICRRVFILNKRRRVAGQFRISKKKFLFKLKERYIQELNSLPLNLHTLIRRNHTQHNSPKTLQAKPLNPKP
jgi:hypothetical protein